MLLAETNVAEEHCLAAASTSSATAVGRAHEQFVSLIEDEKRIRLDQLAGRSRTSVPGDIVADLAARLGVESATISRSRAWSRYTVKLRQRLAAAQAR